MAKIYVDGIFCRIEEENNTSFLRALDKELSFNVQGAKHTRAYKGWVNAQGEFERWDGEQHLLSNELVFPYGLLARVKQFYTDNDQSYEIIDNRDAKSRGIEINILSKLKNLNKDPYYYQLDSLQAAIDNDWGILKLSTGAGKTIIAALIAAKFGKRAIIYVIGTGLLYQIHKLFSSLFDQKIGIIGDGKCEIADINIATVWTIGQAIGLKVKKVEDEGDEKKVEPEKYKAIRELMNDAKLHIIDECHLSACDTIQQIYKHINPEHIYGMSASPWRDDGADLLIETVLGKTIIDVPASKLINEGFLVPPVIKFLQAPKCNKNFQKSYRSIYKDYIIDHAARNQLITLAAQKLVEQNYQTLVLFNSIDHGNILNNLISPIVPTLLLSGKDSSKVREQALNKIESGEIKCIIASKIFDIGIDLPSLSGLIIASGGKSSVRAMQRIGRVIRKHPTKRQAAVVDFIDRAPYLSSHSEIRRQIYETEKAFKVLWLKK